MKVKMHKWEISKASVIGKSHEVSQKPNQDAFAVCSDDSICDVPIIATISDGHGADRYHRSELGSNIAVSTSKTYLELLLEKFQRDSIKFQGIKDYCVEKLPQKLIQSWRREVRKNIQKKPYEKEEKDIYLPYGCTLLGILLYSNVLITFQLGDGDILLVDEDKTVTKEFGKDTNLIANETYSLCMKDAEKFFKINVKRIDHNPPKLILISTDGYSNSFKDDESFYKAGKDFLEIILKDGISIVRENLEGWLKETSDQGSGDDTTMILLYRKD